MGKTVAVFPPGGDAFEGSEKGLGVVLDGPGGHRKSCSEAATTPMPRLEKWWLRVMLCIRSC